MLESIPFRKLFPLFAEILLLHSDVENTVFNPGQPFTKLEKISKRTHMYIHYSDDALWISRVTKNWKKRLGRRGPQNIDSLNEETFIVDVSEVKSAKSLRERIVDHWGYIETQEEIVDIIEVLKGAPEDKIKGRRIKEGTSNYFYL
jgi:esterase/lipase superfamily enzyme